MLKPKTLKLKKPKKGDYEPRKHTWKKDRDGSRNDFAFETGFHNGPQCKVCDFDFCEHCDPELIDDSSCAFNEAMNNFNKKTRELEAHNDSVKIINHYLETGKVWPSILLKKKRK